MKPVLKYRGGKSREIQHFKDHIPKTFNRYLEPFVGGGAVYFYLEHESSIINDINDKLVRFYIQLRDRYSRVRMELDMLQNMYENNQKKYEKIKLNSRAGVYVENKNEELYYELRKLFNYPNGEWLEATLYYFINKTSYGGMIRYNNKGEYNVPFGRYKTLNTRIITENHYRLLKNTKVYNADYSSIFRMAKKDDFMFLDPPYHKATFNDYGNPEHDNGFPEKEHIRLAKEFRKLDCKALMIISKTTLTENLYRDYIVGEYSKSYAVNIRNRFKNGAKHLIVKKC